MPRQSVNVSEGFLREYFNLCVGGRVKLCWAEHAGDARHLTLKIRSPVRPSGLKLSQVPFSSNASTERSDSRNRSLSVFCRESEKEKRTRSIWQLTFTRYYLSVSKLCFSFKGIMYEGMLNVYKSYCTFMMSIYFELN